MKRAADLAVFQSSIRSTGLLKREVGSQLDNGVQPGVDLFNALQTGFDDLEGRNLFIADGLGQFGY
jgi:hypothetical protein